MGSEEKITQTTGDIKEIGGRKITYVKLGLVNVKMNQKETVDKGEWSSISSTRYEIYVPVGQNIRATAEYYSNRQPASAAAKTGAGMLDEIIKIVKALLK